MANVVKKEQQQQQQPAQPQRGELVRDPFRMFSRDPFELMREMMIDPLRMFRMAPFVGGRGEISWSPSFEVRETDDAFVFKADLPGIKNEDVDISLQGNELQITGTREHEQEEGEGQYHAYERSFGSFTRTFALPESSDLDKIHSDLKDGVLTLVVPKKAGASPQKRKIQIGSGGKS